MLLEFIDVGAVSNDLRLPWGADVQAPVRIILRVGTSNLGCLRVRRRPRVDHAEVVLPPSVGGAALVPVFSSADAAVALVSTAVLVTSIVETAGDCSTSVSFALLLNAS
jgi:hypothetical protein